MNYEKLTKLTLRTFLGFLGLSAVIAIVAVLSGDFGKFEAKVIGTTCTISLASICAMSCAAFIARKNRSVIGLSGIGLAVSAALLIIIGIWPEIDGEVYWKTTASISVAAFASAHAFLLVLPNFGNRKKWFPVASALSVAVFALLVIVALWGEIDEEVYYRLMAAVGIVVGLQTVSLPILMKLSKGAAEIREKLVLEKGPDGAYTDAAGRKYQLTEIS